MDNRFFRTANQPLKSKARKTHRQLYLFFTPSRKKGKYYPQIEMIFPQDALIFISLTGSKNEILILNP